MMLRKKKRNVQRLYFTIFLVAVRALRSMCLLVLEVDLIAAAFAPQLTEVALSVMHFWRRIVAPHATPLLGLMHDRALPRC